MASRNGSAEWRGDLPHGLGRVTVGEDALQARYSFTSRYGDGDDDETNPEELLGAAQAACYAMILAHVIARHGHRSEFVTARARVLLVAHEGAAVVERIDIDAAVSSPDLDGLELQRLADEAKHACPVSRALSGVGQIAVAARLV